CSPNNFRARCQSGRAVAAAFAPALFTEAWTGRAAASPATDALEEAPAAGRPPLPVSVAIRGCYGVPPQLRVTEPRVPGWSSRVGRRERGLVVLSFYHSTTLSTMLTGCLLCCTLANAP